jgi:hypothetical protein
MIASIGRYIKGIFTYEAKILAQVVFPVPGGPSNKIAFGRFSSFLTLVSLAIYS